MFGCCIYAHRDRDNDEGLTEEQAEELKNCFCSCHDGAPIMC